MGNLSEMFKLSDFFAENISNRESVRLVFGKIPQTDSVTIDFTDIKFISRAAAHELAVLLENYQNKGNSISLVNVSPEVNKMMETVADSRNVDYKKATFIERITFSTENELDSYLLSI